PRAHEAGVHAARGCHGDVARTAARARARPPVEDRVGIGDGCEAHHLAAGIELAAGVAGTFDTDRRARDLSASARHDADAEQKARPVEELAQARLRHAVHEPEPRHVHGARRGAAGYTEAQLHDAGPG